MKLLRDLSKWYWLSPLLPIFFLVCSIVWDEPMLLFLSVAMTGGIYYLARLHLLMNKRKREARDAKGKGL